MYDRLVETMNIDDSVNLLRTSSQNNSFFHSEYDAVEEAQKQVQD